VALFSTLDELEPAIASTDSSTIANSREELDLGFARGLFGSSEKLSGRLNPPCVGALLFQVGRGLVGRGPSHILLIVELLDMDSSRAQANL